MDLIEDFTSFFKSACVERFLHGQLRPGFLIGWAVMFAAGVMTFLWISLHPDIHSCVTLSGVIFCVGIGLIGNLIQTNTDVEDQESGRYSKMGSGWNLFGDNILFNKFGQFFLTLLIVGSFAMSFYFFTETAHQEADAKVTRVTPKAVAHAPAHSQIHSSLVAHHHTNEKAIHHQTEK